MAAKLTFKYDRQEDILYINKLPPYPEQESEELGDEVIARFNPKPGRSKISRYCFSQLGSFAAIYLNCPSPRTYGWWERTSDEIKKTRTIKQLYPMQRPTEILPSWVTLVEIIRQLEEEPYHWPVGRKTFYAIAYVGTRQGLPTGFVYQKGSFGPFSEDLKYAEAKLVNGNVLQEERHGQMFLVKTGPNFEKVRKEFQGSIDKWKPIIEKTTDLFMRVNTDQAEVIVTVMFAADALKKEQRAEPSEVEVFEAVLRWKQKRRPPLDESDVASTIRNLGMLRWLDVKPAPTLRVPDEDSISA